MSQFSIPEPPISGSEEDSLVGSLDRQRRIFAWKSSDLTSAQLRMGIESSSITIGGLIKHLALVEHEYFGIYILDALTTRA